MLVALIAALALGVALAMDACAVAMTQGARFRPAGRRTLAIAATFGAFQGIMPLIGWAAGAVALAWLAAVDHWIAFILLGVLGARMIRADEAGESATRLSGWALVIAGIATSIDALAAGFALPAMALDPVATCAIIAVVTFAFSALGVMIGARAGDRYGRISEVLGGMILIALGIKILAEHTVLA